MSVNVVFPKLKLDRRRGHFQSLPSTNSKYNALSKTTKNKFNKNCLS